MIFSFLQPLAGFVCLVVPYIITLYINIYFPYFNGICTIIINFVIFILQLILIIRRANKPQIVFDYLLCVVSNNWEDILAYTFLFLGSLAIVWFS